MRYENGDVDVCDEWISWMLWIFWFLVNFFDDFEGEIVFEVM